MKHYIFRIVDTKHLHKVHKRHPIDDEFIYFLASSKKKAIQAKDLCLQDNSHLYEYFGATKYTNHKSYAVPLELKERLNKDYEYKKP
jgi:hypothetical protein